MTKAERIAKGLQDLRTIASVSILRDHLALASQTLEVALATRALAYALEETGYGADSFTSPDVTPDPLVTKGVTLANLARDLKQISLDLIVLEDDRTAQMAVRCAAACAELLATVQAEGVADNLLILAELRTGAEPAA